MKRKVAEIILILLFYLIQVTFGNAIGIGGITPNLLIILPVLFGFFKAFSQIKMNNLIGKTRAGQKGKSQNPGTQLPC